MAHTILLVDDDQQILKSFQSVLAETAYNLLLASTAEEALNFLSENDVDLIVSDVRMPNMDGISLLKIVKEKYPKVVRTILSASGDEKLIFEAVSQNIAKLYLNKPWQNDLLLQQIDRIIHMKEKLDQLKQAETIMMYGDLPTQNSTYLKLTDLLKKNVGINDLAPLIEADLAIYSRVMRIANSAFYGMHAATLPQALVFFGIKYIRELVLTCTLFSVSLSSPLIKKYMDELWNHSLLTSLILTGIYEQLHKEKLPDHAHMMCLLHDVGRVALLDQNPEVFGILYPNLKNHKTNAALGQETELLGINHQELGGLLLDWWDFPYLIVEGALYHHEPLNADPINRKLIMTLHMADRLSWHQAGTSIEPLVDPVILSTLGIELESLKLFMTSITELPFAY